MSIQAVKVLFGVAGVLLIASCGGKSGATRDPIEDRRATLDIKDKWSPESKTCDGFFRPVGSHESYQLDKTYLVSAQEVLDDAATFCKQARIHSRIISGSKITDLGYEESGKLVGDLGKKTCWKKEAGSVVGDPISEEIVEMRPAQATYKFVVGKETLELQLTGADDCPNGTLQLKLKKK